MLVFLHSLKSRLLFLIFIITLPGLFAIFFQATAERNNAIENARLRAVEIVDHITAEQSKIIIKTQSFLQRLSQSPILLSPESPECSEFLANALHLTDYYVNLGAPNADGQLLCNAMPLNEVVNVADRPYIQQAIANREFSIGGFQQDRAAQLTSINFAYPIISADNDQVVGASVAVVSLDWWSQQLEHSNLSKNSLAYITDAKDRILAVYPENKILLGLYLQDVQGYAKSGSDQKTNIIEDKNGALRISVSRTLITLNGNNPVNMTVGISFDNELNMIDSRLTKIVSLLLFFILSFVLFAIFTINISILKPLKALKTSTKQLELGLDSDITSLGGTRELVDLQKNFSLMAKTRLYAEQQLRNSQLFLQESEARLSGHLKNTPLGSIGWDRSFLCTEWNKAAEDIFGYTANEAIGADIRELIVIPELKDEFIEQYNLLLKKTGGSNCTGTNITKDGRTIYCNWYNTLILNSDGTINEIATLVKDITEDKRNQDTLDKFFKLPMNLHVIVNFDGTIIKVNKGWETILGFTSEELVGSNIFALVHPEDIEQSMQKRNKLQVDHELYHFENRYRTKEGKYRLITWSGTASAEEQAIYAMGVDITDHRLIEDKLKLAAGVFTHAKEAIIITDVNNNIIDVNAAFTQLSGYSSKEAIGQNTNMFKPGTLQSAEFYHQIWESISEKGHWTGEIWNKCKDGSITPQLLTISTVYDMAGKVKNYISLYTDISAIKDHQKQLEHIAHYDALTHLPNRSLLADRLKQAMLMCQRKNESLAVLFLDLDGFKIINDFHGHDIGDKLLVEIAHRMQQTLRDGDTLARFGGDEFVAVLSNLETTRGCEPLLERLLTAASSPVQIGDVVIKVSASIGVTIYPHDDVDAEQLLRHADQSMYTAKREGKNRYHLFDMAQDIALKHQHENLILIRNALKKDEFVLYYQPKVNMSTGEIIGVEALIRWQHPDRDLLSPIEFLPMVERHELSIAIGEWVINTALSQISAWQKLGFNTKISVNIDALQLQQDSFVRRLSELLAAYPDVPASSLQLEVLETSQLADIEDVSKIMHACIKLGVGFALDDFGTGYCSLTYLKQLPVDVIKIDQSFIRDMLHDADDLSIVKGVMGLSRAFQRDVIAEGVETLEHGAALLHLGCCFAQGFGIARPMPANELVKWAENWRPDKVWSQVNLT